MKKTLTLIVCFLLFLTACSKDKKQFNDSNLYNENNIIYKNDKIKISKEYINEKINSIYISNDGKLSVDEIYEDTIQYESMCCLALNNNIIYTENDYKKYVSFFVESCSTAENKEEIDSMFEKYKGMDNYLKLSEQDMRRQIIIEKYLKKCEREYAKKKGIKIEDGYASVDFMNEWEEQKDNIYKTTKKEAFNSILKNDENKIKSYISKKINDKKND